MNWQVRFKNPHFWFQIIIAITMPVGAYFGIKAQDVTSWHILWATSGKAIANPYVLLTVGVSVYNAIINPTTKGVRDYEKIK
ncbi:holin [Latilactobacillus curvatus]|uniref:phage holin n=1 Tax=Latilactobacillus curvatus TaxID=28038 RepID=UPI000815100F|nr:phage holin [Latilactobacillus curvatus]ANY14187.1 holin [Latilactobacillus curvatus]